MIQSNAKGDVIVSIGGASYNLSANDEYISFLIRITSPDESEVIDQDAFAVAEGTKNEKREKLLRYSKFLNQFTKIRSEVISEAKSKGTIDGRLLEIRDFIQELKSE